MDFTEINSRGKRKELLRRIDRQNSLFRTAKTTIIKFGLHASFVELESAKSALNEFPECQEFEDLIREKRIELRRNGELREEDCEILGPMDCLRNETLYARYKIDVLPPVECMLPIIEFLFGNLLQDFAYDYSSEEYGENKIT
ncbi:hypothetical protein TNCV_3331331 [Trichonephila clavipes]|nr:hypothetical protein TNCV_3331331 [Trichonephila clavipes]